MRDNFRQSMAWLHTWASLTAGWVLFFVFVTGSATYFYHEITRWMQPELPLRSQNSIASPTALAGMAVDYLSKQPDAAMSWRIVFPTEGERVGCGTKCLSGEDPSRGVNSPLTVFWAKNSERLDSTTGQPLPPSPQTRNTYGGGFFLEMHFLLHYMEKRTGQQIIAICAMLALLAVVTGIIVHKRIFADFFTFRPGKGQRSWLDGHNVSAVMALPFFIMMIYSGLVIEGGYMPKPLLQPPPIKPKIADPAQVPVVLPIAPIGPMVERAEQILGRGEIGEISLSRTAERGLVTMARPWGVEWPLKSRIGSEVNFDADTGELLDMPYTFGQQPGHKALWFFTITHKAWFAGASLRWVMFFSGLLGCVMIATGLILWTVKRRERHVKHGDAPWGLSLVEWVNVSVIAGLPIGVAAYFWANRLLPVTIESRADWEVHFLFITWGWLFLYAALRPQRQAWVEMLWLASAAFGLIPLLNWLTTDRHLGKTLPAGDWVLVGFDLTMLAFAAFFATLAWKLQRKWVTNTQRQGVTKMEIVA